MEESASTEGETHRLGFGEFGEYKYVEILAYKPKYAKFLIEEGSPDHIDRGEFPEWAMCKDVGITAGAWARASE